MLGKLAVMTYALLLITSFCGMVNPVVNYSTRLPYDVVNRILVCLAAVEVGILVVLAFIAIWRY